jgi:hypothetical protein
MFSKKLISYLIPLIVISCAKENDPHPLGERQNVFKNKTECMAPAGVAAGKFLEGTATTEELSGFWDCSGQVISIFQLHFKPNNKGLFKSVDLRDFFQDLFIKEGAISNALLLEGMRIKQILLGGAVDSVSREEIHQTEMLILSLRKISERLRPQMAILALSMKPGQASEAQVEEAITVLDEALSELAPILSKYNHEYAFKSLQSLFLELSKFYGKKKIWAGPAKIADFIPLIANAKKLLVNGRRDRIEPKEWADLFHVTARAYGTFLRWNYFASQNSVFEGQGLQRTEEMSEAVFKFIREAIARRTNAQIDYDDLDACLEEIMRLKLLPIQLTPESSAKTLRLLFGKWPYANGSAHPQVTGLTLNSVEFYHSQLSDWFQVQKALVAEKENKPGPPTFLALQQMTDLRAGPWPIVIDTENRVLLRFDQPLAYDFHSLTQMNWARAIFSILMISYGEPAHDGIESGVSDEKFEELYKDLFSILVDAKFCDEKDDELWVRIAGQTPLFLPRSNGDHVTSMNEAYEFLTYYFSAHQLGSDWLETMKTDCPVTASVGGDTVSAQCFRDHAFQSFSSVFANLPQLSTYILGLSAADQKTWMKFSEMAVRKKSDTLETDPILVADIRLMTLLYQFIETYYGRFDLDRSQKINLDESMIAGPIYFPTVMDLLGLADATDAEAVYSYMFKYGEPPPGLLDFVWWKWHKSKWEYDSDRLILIKILANLASQKQ